MKQGLEEQKIRRLFQQLKQDDERSAPGFESVLAQKPERVARSRSLAFGFATAVVLLATFLGAWLLWANRSKPASQEQIAQPIVTPERKPNFVSPSPTDPTPTPEREAGRVPSPRRRGPLRLVVASAALISQWRSPTQTLLSTPGCEIMKSVPKLDDSIIRVNQARPIENN